MRVCLDLTINEVDRYGGIWRYAIHLLPALQRAIADGDGERDWELYALWSSGEPPERVRDATEPNRALPDRVGSFRHRWRRRAHLGSLLTAAHIDLFHNTEPAAFPLRAGCRLVTTVYDEIPIVFPARAPRTRLDRALVAAKRARHRWRCARADRVIAISAQTKGDLVRAVGVDPRRISVVPLGVDRERFHPRAAANESTILRARYDLPERYFICVGSDHYRKNQRRLVDAWCRVTSEVPEGLVFVGQAIFGDAFAEIGDEIARRGLGARFRWLARVPDDELPALYRQASAAIAPSVYEGFGLTLLEAMACGTPVAASRNGAYEEVAGDAAAYFDPLSIDEIAATLHSLSRDAALRATLGTAGLERAAQATWKRAAEETLAVYRQVLRGSD